MDPRAIAQTLSSALAAVSGQIKAYFEESGRFQREFVFPGATFSLALLGLLMLLVGPDVPRAWWDSLGTDLKLLVTALLGLLLVLFVEASRLLVITVRQLYSGEWPGALWWFWEPLRTPYVRKRHQRRVENETLSKVDGTLDRVMTRVGAFGPEAPPVAYPVARRRIGAYALVTGDDLTVGSPVKADPKAAPTPDLVVGRYAVTAISPGTPIPADVLRTPPDARYLGADRAIVTVPVDAATQVLLPEVGTVVRVHLAPRRGLAPGSCVPDVLVLDRLPHGDKPATHLVLAVAGDRAATLVSRAASGDLRFTWGSAASSPGGQSEAPAIAVAAGDIVPGTLLTERRVAWRLRPPAPVTAVVPGRPPGLVAALVAAVRRSLAAPAQINRPGHASPGPPAPQPAELIGRAADVSNRVYWPRSVTGGPATLRPTLRAGDILRASDLRTVPHPGWLSFEQGGQTRDRRACRLDTTGKVLEFQGESDVPAPGPDDVKEGDRVAVQLDGDEVERDCYVFHRAGRVFDLAVRDPDRFQSRAQTARTVRLSAYRLVPVLRAPAVPGQPLDHGHVVTRVMRGSAPELRDNVCLEIADVVDHVVRSYDERGRPVTESVPRNVPIPRRRLGEVAPSAWECVALNAVETAGEGWCRLDVQQQARVGGHVVVEIRAQGRRPFSWTGRIAELEALPGSGALVGLRVTVPGDRLADVRRGLAEDWTTAVVTLVGTDASTIPEPAETTVPFRPRPGESTLAGRVAVRADLYRGGLVSVRVEAPGAEPVEWTEAFVYAVDEPVPGDVRRIVLAVPGEQRRRVLALPRGPGTHARITVTHTDRTAILSVEALAAEIERYEDVTLISDAIASETPAEELQSSAEAMERSAARLEQLRVRLVRRAWASDPTLSPGQYATTYRRAWELGVALRSAPEAWKDAVKMFTERREAELQLALPDMTVDMRPTALGNILAAAADHPRAAYGIDTVSILPRLLDAVGGDDQAVKRLINAEGALNMLLLFSFWLAVWSVLALVALPFVRVATPGAVWVLAPAIVGAVVLAWLAKEAAKTQALAYGDALKSLFDLRRHSLLIGVGFELGQKITPDQEQKLWIALQRLYARSQTKEFPPVAVPQSAKKA